MYKKVKDIASDAADTIKKTANKAYHQVKSDDDKSKECCQKVKSAAGEVVEKAGEILEEGGEKIKEMGKKL